MSAAASASVYSGSGSIGRVSYDDATGKLMFTAAIPDASASNTAYAISYGTVDVQVDVQPPSADTAGGGTGQWAAQVTVMQGGTDKVIGGGSATADGHSVTATAALGRSFGAYLDAGMKYYKDYADGTQVPSTPDFVRLSMGVTAPRAAPTRLTCSQSVNVVLRRVAPRACDILYPNLYLSRGVHLRGLHWRRWGAASAIATGIDDSLGAAHRRVTVLVYRRRSCARDFIYTRLRETSIRPGFSRTYNTSVC